jgi:hypothetical protein
VFNDTSKRDNSAAGWIILQIGRAIKKGQDFINVLIKQPVLSLLNALL